MAVLRALTCASMYPVAVQAFARTSSIAIRGYRPFATARPSDFDEVVDRAAAVAESAARAAGKEIMAGMGAAVKKQKMNFKDIVTEVDGRCQELIRSEVAGAFPDHHFLGEEDVPPGAAEASAAIDAGLAKTDWVWIVDPVDGTANLAAGIPLVTTCIALCWRGEVAMGVVYDPNRDEMFVARRGRGAYLNGDLMPATASDSSLTLQDAMLCMGNPPDPDAFQKNLRVLAELGPRVRGVRILSSAALVYSWVALGRITAYVASDINAWDFAAAQLVLEEVGGTCSNHQGDPLLLTHRDTVCSRNGVHDEVIGALKAIAATDAAKK